MGSGRVGQVKRFRQVIGVGAVTAAALVGSSQPASSDYSPADSGPFLVSSAVIATVDQTPHAQFSITCDGADTSPTWLVDGTAPTCTNGELAILVTPATKYYAKTLADGSPCTTESGCAYRPTTYDAMMASGATVRVGGQWIRQQYDRYEFYATYIWTPGNDVNDPPPNPTPVFPQDYNFSSRFVVDASVAEAGTGLVLGLPWSERWGLVAGKITDTYQNTLVDAIAANHRDPVTLDPQLQITTNDAYPVSTIGFMPPLTRYWVERQDPADGQYKFFPATKEETVVSGAQLRVAGAFGFVDGDWRFLAYFVWRPAPSVSSGVVDFHANTTLTSSGAAPTTSSARYDGTSATGPGQVNPATVRFDTAWSYDGQNRLWDVSGTWEAVRSVDPPGAVSGTFSGTWNPITGELLATSVMDRGTGVFCGVTGGGTFTGTATAGSPTAPAPPSTLNGQMVIRASVPSNPTC
jgi:hypothetical protein